MAHRLVAPLAQVDDRQAGVNETDVARYLDSPVVRPAMAKRVAHRNQTIRVWLYTIRRNTSPNAAHPLTLS
jgi:hypothetical protein